MNKNDIEIRYLSYLNECRKHLKILNENFKKLKDLFPLTKSKIKNLLSYPDGISLLDQIAYRFIKLQDTLGKLLRIYLFKEGELIENLSMIDIVNLAEKLGFPIDESLWMELRFLRNAITHDYPETFDEVAEALNKIEKILSILDKAINFF
jgi:hypothetical protein